MVSACSATMWVLMGAFDTLVRGVGVFFPLRGLSIFARSWHAEASANMPRFIARSARSKQPSASGMLATVAISSASVLVPFSIALVQGGYLLSDFHNYAPLSNNR